MRFFYLLSPATWLKIALASLVLGAVSLFVLAGYRVSITREASNHASISATVSVPSASVAAPALPSVQPPVVAHNPPTNQQNQAIAPEGILDQYAEFNPVLAFDDTPIKPDYVLPAPVAPVGLLDPKWTGVAP